MASRWRAVLGSHSAWLVATSRWQDTHWSFIWVPMAAALMLCVRWQSLQASASSPLAPWMLAANAWDTPLWHCWQATLSPPVVSLAERVACGSWQSEHSGAFALPAWTCAEWTLSSYCFIVFLWQSRQVSMSPCECSRLLLTILGSLLWALTSMSEWQPSQPLELCTDSAKPCRGDVQRQRFAVGQRLAKAGLGVAVQADLVFAGQRRVLGNRGRGGRAQEQRQRQRQGRPQKGPAPARQFGCSLRDAKACHGEPLCSKQSLHVVHCHSAGARPKAAFVAIHASIPSAANGRTIR